MGDKEFGQDSKIIQEIAKDIINVYNTGVKICVVVGGGNIFRGIKSEESNLERVQGDHIGMLATVMNAIALQSAIESCGVETRVMSAIQISAICEFYIRRKAQRHMDKGRIVIFAGGIGNPFFTTDTCAVLRSVEMGCDAVIKGTSVDGVYSADPKKNPKATKHDKISYADVLKKNLQVMDMAAISLASDNKMPIYIFSIKNSKNPLSKLIQMKEKYSIIS